MNKMLKMDYFWVETINTTFYILSYVSIRNYLNKNLSELLKNINPSISYFHIFRWHFYIVNNKKNQVNLILNQIMLSFWNTIPPLIGIECTY